MKFFSFKKKSKNEKIISKNATETDQLNAVKPKSARENKRQMIKAAKALRRARRKTVQKKPFTRIMSLILAGLMLFGFVSGAVILIWNFFFPPKPKATDLGDFDLQKMIESLSKFKEPKVEDELGDVDDGANSDAEETKTAAPDEAQQPSSNQEAEKNEEIADDAATGESGNESLNAKNSNEQEQEAENE